ncbi:hypothetical protein IWX49DRAFT_316929 [Phyllosticta citricarpa]|uniref:Uncharacterized protein n=1 Tax=Phyllosticta citricarpa TaxID=55181 RepID=A0ABR1LE99_9PEZI
MPNELVVPQTKKKNLKSLNHQPSIDNELPTIASNSAYRRAQHSMPPIIIIIIIIIIMFGQFEECCFPLLTSLPFSYVITESPISSLVSQSATCVQPHHPISRMLGEMLEFFPCSPTSTSGGPPHSCVRACVRACVRGTPYLPTSSVPCFPPLSSALVGHGALVSEMMEWA